MNNDYSLNDDGRACGRSCAKAANKLHWFQKTRINTVFTNTMFIVCLILFIFIVVAIYWNYIRPRQNKTICKKLLQFAGFKYSHLTNQEIKEYRDDMGLGLPKDACEAPHINSHFIIYGSSGSGKTSFLKHYLGPYT